MNKVQANFSGLKAWAEKLSLREQLLITVTVASLLAFTLQLSLVDPLLAQHEILKSKIRTAENVKKVLQTQVLNGPHIQKALQKKQLKDDIKTVERDLEALESETEKYASSLVSPGEMPALLQILLAEQSLQVVKMTNIKPILVMQATEQEEKDGIPLAKEKVLYRHGITITLRGSFNAVFNYLLKLESQPWKLIWSSMEYNVTDYPVGELDLHLQTLSTDQHWLDI